MACIFGHKWNGCKCQKCGKTRNEGHLPVDGKCSVCGAVLSKDGNHAAATKEASGKKAIVKAQNGDLTCPYCDSNVGNFLRANVNFGNMSEAQAENMLYKTGMKCPSCRKELGPCASHASISTDAVQTTQEEDVFYERFAALIKASYEMDIVAKVTGGGSDALAANAVRKAYADVSAKYGAEGTKKLYAMCIAQNPNMEDFLVEHFR